jgi:hypothetical protein
MRAAAYGLVPVRRTRSEPINITDVRLVYPARMPRLRGSSHILVNAWLLIHSRASSGTAHCVLFSPLYCIVLGLCATAAAV